MIKTISTLEQYKRYLSKKHLNKLEKKTDIESKLCAEKTIIRLLQAKHFPDEYQKLRNGKPIPKGSALHKLTPILDERGLIRVGGRLEYSHYLEYEK